MDGQTHLRVSFEKVQPIDPANQKWLLTVHFGVAQRRPDAQDMTYSPTVLLRFTPPISGAMAKELPFAIEAGGCHDVEGQHVDDRPHRGATRW